MVRLILLISLVLCVSSARAGSPGIPLVDNKGQWPSHVISGVDVEHGKWFLERQGFTVHQYDLSAITRVHQGEVPVDGTPQIRGHVFRVEFEGSSPSSVVKREGSRPEYFNYFLGNDPSQWAGECRSYNQVILQHIYPRTDLKVYSDGPFLKYDFIVHPGGNAALISLHYSGHDALELEHGRLKIRTSVGEVWEQKPISWQIVNGQKRLIRCEYELNGDRVSFSFPNGYDKSKELIIDPVLIFSTYSGSFSDNFGFTATYDSQGYLYSGSSAFGQGYPTTVGAYQTTWGGGTGSVGLAGTDIALTKYNLTGTGLVWSSFIGGANDELPHSLICNSNDELLMYGTTSSPNFPTTSGAYDVTFNGGSAVSPQGVGVNYINGSDIVVVRFNAAGSALIGSTFLGGTANDGVNNATVLKFNYADEFRGEIDIDADGSVFIASCTYSVNFPIVGGFQQFLAGSLDGCVVKLNANLTAIIWSTYIGGINDDSAYSAAFDDQGNVYVCGGTKSNNFPVTQGSLFSTYQGGTADGWIARIAANGQSIMQSSYFGSSAYDQLYFVETSSLGEVFVYGQTRAPGSTWVINATWSQPNSGMVVTKLSPNLNQIVWSTVFGSGSGVPNLSPTAFTVDVCGKIYLSGWGGTTNTASNSQTGNVSNMFVTPGAFKTTTTGSDFYLLVLLDDASGVYYATYYGGNVSAEHVDGGTSRFDKRGVIYQSVCAGCGNNNDFPIYPPNAHSPTNNSNNCNNGVFKFDFQAPLTVANFNAPTIGCTNAPIQFNQTSTLASTYLWDFGDGITSDSPNPSHIYTEPGTYTITLTVTNPDACNFQDLIEREIEITFSQTTSLNEVSVCEGGQAVIGPTNPNPTFTYTWIPANFLSGTNVPNPMYTAGTDIDYILLAEHGGCTDTLFQSVQVISLELNVPADMTICDATGVDLTAIWQPSTAGIIWSDTPNFSNVLNEGPQDATITVSPESPTTYYAQVSLGNCTETASVLVNLVSSQTQILGDFIACEGDTISLFVLDPNNSFVYTWSPALGVISGQGTGSIQAVVTEDIVFGVVSETPEGCTSLDEVLIEVSTLTADQLTAFAQPPIIVIGQSSQLQVDPAGYNYQWSPVETLTGANTSNPIAQPLETTTYYVTVADGDCHFSTSLTLRVEDFVCGPPSIYVPNAYTPNGDGRNDVLAVRGNNLTDVYLAIFDRWGEKVYETTVVNVGWDGTFRGRSLDPDVYVYYLRALCAGGQEYEEQGNITLIR